MSWTGRSLFRLVASLTLLVELASARSIAVSKACYNFDEPITINFDNTGSPGPAPDIADWIGLVKASTLNVAAVSTQPNMWVWACGDQFCPNASSGGTVVFGPNPPDETGNDSWPLDAGNYVAVLTGGPTPYQARALSINFRVMPQGQVCPGGQGSGQNDNVSNQNPDNGSNQNNDNTNDQNSNNNGSATGGVKVLSGMERFVEDAKADIRSVINFDRRLAPKFLRLAFHDCVGGCDGCIDMTNPDNGGLEFAIGSLDAVVQKYASRGLSRTDIWMLSAIVSSELLQPPNQAIAWPFQWVGRKTCKELNNSNCGANTCDQRRGPDRHLPHSDIGTGTILEFFNKEFGWNARQTTAIMGAHSVGSLRRFNVGFDGEGGWDLTNNSLDNGYFIELVGQSGNPDDIPDFRQVVVPNNDIASMPSRMQFEANVGGRKVVMLTADLALVRQIDEGSNLRSDGAVLCTFKGFDNRCPDAPATFGHIVEYSRNGPVFLNDFRDVMFQMIDHGYRRTGTCPLGSICELEVN